MDEDTLETVRSWRESAGAYIAFQDAGDGNRTLLLDPVMLDLCGDVRGQRVLDLGCGEGRFCRMLADRGAIVTGIDAIAEMIHALPFADAAFDLVVSYITLVEIVDYASAVREAARVLRRKFAGFKPRVGIVLGTGLGGVAKRIKAKGRLPYGQVPHFPVSTVEGHSGRLVWGTLDGTPVLAMEGRFHVYEGHSLEQITLPVRVMRALGARTLLVSNACGGLNPQFQAGDLMLIEDHINLMGVNPLIGPNDDRLGPRFPDMCEPYDLGLIARAEKAALKHGIGTHRGVYVAVSGPNLETRAEYRMLRGMAADVSGCPPCPR